jgi:hypothetical protein
MNDTQTIPVGILLHHVRSELRAVRAREAAIRRLVGAGTPPAGPGAHAPDRPIAVTPRALR